MKKYSFLAYIGLFFTAYLLYKRRGKDFYQGESVVEFDATVFNSGNCWLYLPNFSKSSWLWPCGLHSTYFSSLDPSITRTSGTVKLRVNLVGAQRPTDELLTYRVMTEAVPTAPNILAISGTHYTTGNTLIIPANSSFGEITIKYSKHWSKQHYSCRSAFRVRWKHQHKGKC